MANFYRDFPRRFSTSEFDILLLRKEFFPDDPQTAYPLTATLSVDGVAPSVSISDNKVISPGAGNLILSGFTPNVLVSLTIYPLQGNLVVTGVAPNTIASDNKTVYPLSGSVILTGLAPRFDQSVLVYPKSSELIVSGKVPDAIAIGYYREKVINATVSLAGDYTVTETTEKTPDYIVSSTIVRATENIVQ